MVNGQRDYEAERRRMLEDHLKARGISDRRVLAAMGRVPRERFVPPEMADKAYFDGALGIGCGQTISQPFIVALMSESLHLTGTERVLEVGTGSGYQAAILAELAAHVYTIETVAALAESARQLLTAELGYTNISFRVGDGTLGWLEEAPFDRLIVTAAAPHRPHTLLGQLAPWGEAVLPVGPRDYQMLKHYRRLPDGDVEERDLCQCVFVQLIGEEGW